MAREAPAGHRLVPHTADLRIEAWASTAERCVAEATHAMVRSFADLPPAPPTAWREFVVPAADDEMQLVAVLDEVIYRLDTDDEIPQHVDVRRDGKDLRVVMGMTDIAHVTIVGAVPKAVSLHGLRFAQHEGCWRCNVTVDAGRLPRGLGHVVHDLAPHRRTAIDRPPLLRAPRTWRSRPIPGGR